MRRFSAKEERRRVVAAPLVGGRLPGRNVGLENHLNYIHRPKGKMSRDEVTGLAALLCSALVDRYFRISNGNTQVSAIELRQLRLPKAETIEAIGRAVNASPTIDLDETIHDALHVPAHVRGELERVANVEGRRGN
jgi:adenine-specific DNA-methyltransferase